MENESPERVNYNAFGDDDYDQKPVNNLKISNKQPAKQSKPDQQNLKSAAIEHTNKSNVIRSQISDLTLKYKAAILDKTLQENKSPLSKTNEQEIIKLLTTVASELNNDTSQPESIGSLGLNTLLLQICLIQRDQINILNYEVSKMKKILADVTFDDNK